MPVQVTLGFATDLGKGGAWDEVYETGFDNLAAAILAWQSVPLSAGLLVGISGSTTVCAARLNCLSSQCYLYYIRYAGIDASKAIGSSLQRMNVPGNRSAENFAADAATMRVRATGDPSVRNIRLGGLPDNVVIDNQIQQSFVQNYITGSGGFLPLLAGIGQGVIRLRIAVRSNPVFPLIVAASKALQYGLVSVILNKPWAYGGVGALVDLLTRGQPQIRGRWKINALSSDMMTVTLAGSERVSAPATLTGQLLPYVPDVQAINPTVQGLVGLSAHKLGKKKFPLRGRRSPVLVRH